jgi:hypothetical protein
MAPSLAKIPDHWLWLGLGTCPSISHHAPLTPPGVFTFVAIKQVSHGLQHIRSVTEVRKPSLPRNPTRLPPHPTHQEDAIKTSSLLILATSPNIDIRTSATKILCQRFYASPSAKRLLVRDLNSKNEEVKHRAQLAYNLLYDHNVLHESSLAPRIPRNGWRLHEPLLNTPTGGVDAQDLRRRRREAVVIHDGDMDRPIGQEDVYMRDEDGDLERRFQALSEDQTMSGTEVVHEDGENEDAEAGDIERRFQELGEIEMGRTSVLVAEDENDGEADVQVRAA